MRLKSAIAATAFGIMAALGTVSPAHALVDGDSTTCDHSDGTLCLYYLHDHGGSRVGIYGIVYNYDYNPTQCGSSGCNPLWFATSGSGSGQKVRNNAESFYNENSSTVYRIYYSPNLGGTWDEADPLGQGVWSGNLNHAYDNNASQWCQCAAA